jgi:hypothetical protein
MMPPDHPSALADAPREPAETNNSEATGLPWLHTWRGIYVFVIGCFVLWVVLLFALTKIFS